IVWWRAWNLWRSSRGVLLLYVALALATFGTYDMVLSTDRFNEQATTTSGTLFSGNQAGSAASVLTLVTNISATILVGMKALEHRDSVRRYLKVGSRRTRAEKILAILLESGIVYCVIWVCSQLSFLVYTHCMI
ncbi:hypothetical protein C8Q74DRAFT_1188102, partial [Fomes fomentarius]